MKNSRTSLPALAHDFKQPIRQIITFSQMIADELQDVKAGGVQQHLTFLGHAPGRLDKLVEVMLQYTLPAQPAARTFRRRPEQRAGERPRASLAPLLAERGAKFVTPASAPLVRGNETLMIQVLQNLIVNGLHYNRNAIPRVELTTRREGGDWVIKITDNGIGIEANIWPRYSSR